MCVTEQSWFLIYLLLSKAVSQMLYLRGLNSILITCGS